VQSYLTKDELSSALGVSVAMIRQWAKDGVIPPRLYIVEGNAYSFTPLALAVGELILRLRKHFGANSPLPIALTMAALPAIERLWHEAGELSSITVWHENMQVILKSDFIARAKERLATIA
jgi:hypothetical protein